MVKVDMHCHSDHSNLLDRWFYYKMGAKECYTRPEQLYSNLKSRGMDFVTITDHDTISGALELAEKHLDAFVSCEFTVHFFNADIDVHICVYDLTEEQFRAGRKLASDVRVFADFIREEGLVASVAHPMHSFGSEWRLAHLEQLVLLFENFEEKNGLLMHSINKLQRDFLNSLTPDRIEDFIARHKIVPAFDTPWKKGRTAGSDDHSSYYLGRCWTETETAATSREFLQAVQAKKSRVDGSSNNGLTFAHTIQVNVAKALMNNLCEPSSTEHRVDQLARKLVGEQSAALGFVNSRPQDGEMEFPFIRQRETDLNVGHFLNRALRDWSDPGLLLSQVPGRNLQEETFCVINTWFNNLIQGSLDQFVDRLRSGEVAEAFGKLGLLAPAAIMLIPYIESFKHCHGNFAFRDRVAERYDLRTGQSDEPAKWAWFTDTMSDINGVARTIQTMSELAEKHKTPITTITCCEENPAFQGAIANFKPVCRFEIPEYEFMSLCLPPFLEMLSYCEKMNFSRFIISTPGPVGLMAFGIAKILGIKTAGIYHTDLPSYVRILTRDRKMEQLTWTLMRWFYGGMERVYSLTDSYRDLLAENGIDKDKIHIFPKGTDVEFFHPRKRNPQIWKDLGVDEGLKILYVGRVSKEKSIDVLCRAYASLREELPDARLIIVGDGPGLADLKAEFEPIPGILFTGFIEGPRLAEIYAGADLFVFPSTTDTYGSVVLEAQASGLPAIVSDMGGPKEVIVRGKTGFVVRAKDADHLAMNIRNLAENDELRRRMGREARIHAEQKSWSDAFFKFRQSLEGPAQDRTPPESTGCKSFREAI